MYIQEKYLLKPDYTNGANGAGVSSDSSITILKCKYCGREFMVPNDEIGNITVMDVCESEPCKTSYEKQYLASKLEEIKNQAGEVTNTIADKVKDTMKKVLAD